VFRYKYGLPESSIKNDIPGQGFNFNKTLTPENFEVPINDFNYALETKTILRTDFKIGFVEITSITEDSTQLLLFLEDEINEKFIGPFFYDLFRFIVPTRIIKSSIDPEIEEQLFISMPDLQTMDLLDDEESNNEAGINTGFSNQTITHYEFDGKKPNDDLMIHMWKKGKPVSEIAHKLSYSTDTINNRIAILRNHLGKEVIPYRIPQKK
jgi:hypothetical protein